MSLGWVKKTRLFAKDTPEDVRVLSLYPFASPRVCPALITPQHCNTITAHQTPWLTPHIVGKGFSIK